MFQHNKRLQHTVRVAQPNPALANLLLEQFGGPQGELAAAMRYFTQALAEEDPGRKDMLLDIATEELSHLEIVGSLVAMLNRGAKGKLAEITDQQAAMFRELQGQGNDSHVTQVLYGGGPALVNSAGVPWSGAYVDSIGEPTVDLRSNIAAEARAKIVYERLINVTDDQDIRKTLGFLMTREIAHQMQFEKALFSIDGNFPPGKLSGDKRFADVYVNASSGDGDHSGPWNNGDEWKVITPDADNLPVDSGDGSASVKLPKDEASLVSAFAARTASNPNANPAVGKELTKEASQSSKPKPRASKK